MNNKTVPVGILFLVAYITLIILALTNRLTLGEQIAAMVAIPVSMLWLLKIHG